MRVLLPILRKSSLLINTIIIYMLRHSLPLDIVYPFLLPWLPLCYENSVLQFLLIYSLNYHSVCHAFPLHCYVLVELFKIVGYSLRKCLTKSWAKAELYIKVFSVLILLEFSHYHSSPLLSSIRFITTVTTGWNRHIFTSQL